MSTAFHPGRGSERRVVRRGAPQAGGRELLGPKVRAGLTCSVVAWKPACVNAVASVAPSGSDLAGSASPTRAAAACASACVRPQPEHHLSAGRLGPPPRQQAR